MTRLSSPEGADDDETIRGSPVSWSGESVGGASTPGDFEWRPPGRLANRSAISISPEARARVSGSHLPFALGLIPSRPRPVMSSFSRIVAQEDDVNLPRIIELFEQDAEMTAEAIRELDVEQWKENANVSGSSRMSYPCLTGAFLLPAPDYSGGRGSDRDRAFDGFGHRRRICADASSPWVPSFSVFDAGECGGVLCDFSAPDAKSFLSLQFQPLGMTFPVTARPRPWMTS